MVERLGEMRKERRERIENVSSRERIIKKRERDNLKRHCFFKPSVYDNLEQHQNLAFTSL